MPAHLPTRVRRLLGPADGGRIPIRRARRCSRRTRQSAREDPRRDADAQHTILEVPRVLGDAGFRRQVLKRTSDPAIRHWFDGYFEPLELRQRLEIINPVQTKVHKYLGSKVARQIVGQPRSTIDFRRLIAERQDRASST